MLVTALRFLVAIAMLMLAVVAASGQADDANGFLRAIREGRWSFVAACLMVAIFTLAVLPEIWNTFLGNEAVRLRQTLKALERSEILVLGHTCNGLWLMKNVGGEFLSGVLSGQLNYPAISIVDAGSGRSGSQEWLSIKDMFAKHGLIDIQPTQVNGRQVETWRLTPMLGTAVYRTAVDATAIEPRLVLDEISRS